MNKLWRKWKAKRIYLAAMCIDDEEIGQELYKLWQRYINQDTLPPSKGGATYSEPEGTN